MEEIKNKREYWHKVNIFITILFVINFCYGISNCFFLDETEYIVFYITCLCIEGALILSFIFNGIIHKNYDSYSEEERIMRGKSIARLGSIANSTLGVSRGNAENIAIASTSMSNADESYKNAKKYKTGTYVGFSMWQSFGFNIVNAFLLSFLIVAVTILTEGNDISFLVGIG